MCIAKRCRHQIVDNKAHVAEVVAVVDDDGVVADEVALRPGVTLCG